MTEDEELDGFGVDSEPEDEAEDYSEYVEVPLELEEPELMQEIESIKMDRMRPNILKDVELQDEEWLKKFVRFVVDCYEDGWERGEEHRLRFMKDWKLFESQLPEKTQPWPGCSNANIPILFQNITRLALRIEGELFGDWKQVMSYIPMSNSPESRALAESMSKHDNWQLLHDSPGFRRAMRKGIMLFLFGEVTFEVSYDERTRTNRVEALTPDEFVVPYTTGGHSEDWSDVPWRARRRLMFENELKSMTKVFDPEKIEEVLDTDPPDWFTSDDSDSIAENMASSSGDEPSGMERDSERPYEVVTWEGWYDVPGNEEQMYLQLVFERHSRVPLKLCVWEEYDWRDQERFQMQLQQKQEYLDAVQQHRQMVEQYPMLVQQYQQDVIGFQQQASAYQNLAEQMGGQAMDPNTGEPIPPPEPPQEPEQPGEPPRPPKWMDEGQALPGMDPAPPPMRFSPISSYAHAVCIEPLTGNRGVGFGRPLGDFNRAAKASFDRYNDAATLANVSAFLVSRKVNLDSDQKALKPGAFITVDHSGDDIRQGVLPLSFQPPSDSLRMTVETFVNWGNAAVQAPDVLSGAEGKSGETAKGLGMRIEQATAQLRVVTLNFAGSVSRVIDLNRWLNSKHLDDEQSVSFHDQAQDAMVAAPLRRRDYQRNYRHTLSSDVRFATRTQRVAEADEVMGIIQTPPLMMNPIAAAPLAYEAVKMALMSRGMDHLVQLLGPPPPPPPPGNYVGMPPMPPPGAVQEQSPEEGENQ